MLRRAGNDPRLTATSLGATGALAGPLTIVGAVAGGTFIYAWC